MIRHSRAFTNLCFANLCVLGILVLSVRPLGAEELGIPILAWVGPPESETSEGRYRELAEAGFTHNFSNFSNTDAMRKALDVAQATGIKQFISCPELHAAPEIVAERFKGHPALAGYHLRDEPSAADFPALAKWVTRIQSIDPVHPCYINLFPNYANGAQLGTATYKEHLDRYLNEVPVPLVSFDHYPVVGHSLRGEWYENLEQVSSAAKASQKPFWAFALSVAHDPYPIAEIEHLRLQIFSNLAYGAQGIQYFTYWTVKSPHWNFHQAPIEVDGTRTVVYDRVKQVNSEIRALAKVFHGAEVLSVGHTGKLPRGTSAFEPTFPVKNLKTGETGAVISRLAKGNQIAFVIVNRDLRSKMPLAVTFDPAARITEVTKEGTTRSISSQDYQSELTAGDIRVFTWKKN
ncbi:MAG TPA: beta-galactosidase [Chthoniobacteraceae bacterium]|nr:beta-galactosidase [Chthoniobacteraceae bacterium]